MGEIASTRGGRASNSPSANAPTAPRLPSDNTTDFAPIAGFWRRVAAFVVDGLILALVGEALGLSLFDFFVRLGPWGRCVGMAVALAYFVPQESSRSGQSLGKRLLRIRVVDAQGRSLGEIGRAHV